MATFTLRHDIECSADKFWQLFWNDEIQRQIFVKELGFPKWEVVEQKETDKEIIRIVRATPKMDAPAAVTKVLGDGFGYTEEGRFDKASRVYRFVVKPSSMADKLKNEGSVRCEPKGDAKCTRIVDVVAEAKIMLVGGLIEKLLEKGSRDGWEMSARIFSEHAKKG